MTTLSEAIDLYRDSQRRALNRGKISPQHVRNTRDSLKTLQNRMGGDLPIQDLKAVEVKDMILDAADGLISTNALQMKNTIRPFCNWIAHDAGLVARPPWPLQSVELRRIDQEREGQVLSDDQIAFLWKHGAAFTRFRLLSGVRRDMARCLQWEWLDLDRGLIYYPANTMGLKDRRQGWYCPLSDAMADCLPARVQSEGYVFGNPRTGKPPFDGSEWRRLRERTPGGSILDDARGHDVRPTLATWAQSNRGFPVEVVETALSHRFQHYRKSAFVEERRDMLTQWAGHVSGVQDALTAAA